MALGTNTDPYQWVEGRYRLMEGIWEALLDAAQPLLDPHEVAAAAPGHQADAPIARAGPSSARACRSRRSTRRPGGKPSRTRQSPGSPGGGRRAERAGIPTGVLVAPLMPGNRRRAAPGRAAAGSGRAGRRDERRGRRAAPPRRGPRRVHGLDEGEAARSRAALRGALQTPRLRASGRTGAALAARAPRRRAAPSGARGTDARTAHPEPARPRHRARQPSRRALF